MIHTIHPHARQMIHKARLAMIWLAGAGLLFALPSCNGHSDDQPDKDDEQVRSKIEEYAGEISRLTQEKHALQQTLRDRGEYTGRNDLVPVMVSELAPADFVEYIRVSGTVEAVKTATISPETSGHIRRIYAEKGEAVERGQVLARLSTDVVQGNIEEVKTSLELAETVYQRQKRLWDQQIGSEMQYLEAKNQVERLLKNLETLQSQLDMAVLKAPFDGFVDEHFIKEGELASPGTPVMQVVNLDELYVNADVSESYLPYVTEGREVILRFPAWPETQIKTPVHRVGHVINPENRSFRMQLRIPNDDGRYKPNMMARISVQAAVIQDAMVVPSMLIGFDTQGHYVYVAEEGPQGIPLARKAYIERGRDGEGKTQVKEGLTEGDLLIVQGHRQVASGEGVHIRSYE